MAAQSDDTRPPNATDGTYTLRNFVFRSGATLSELRMAYTTLGWPRRGADGEIDNAVLLLHGTTSTSQSWLAPLLGDSLFRTGQPLDASRYYVIIPDSIGLGRSSKPSDGLQSAFPKYGYHDMVTAQHLLVTQGLGIGRLRLVIGTSMGGMHTFLWAERYPQMLEAAVAVAALPAQISGRNLLWRRVITEAIRNDAGWLGGKYTVAPTRFVYTMPLFQVMGSSAIRLQENAPSRAEADAAYDKLVEEARRIDPNDYLYRFESSYDYAPEAELDRITAPLLVILFADDEINPLETGVIEKLMPKIKNGRYVVIPADSATMGHQNLRRGALWAPHLAAFIDALSPK
jgi:homoserine O-acetyltransferase